MAKFVFDGIEQYIKELDALNIGRTGMIKLAVYDGAAVVVKSIADAIDALPEGSTSFVPPGGTITGINAAQRAGLREGLGLAKMKNENGFINTKVGFDGYNGYHTRAYPNGQPNALIARALESGTSMRPKTRFVSKAVSSCKDAAEQAMAARFDAALQKTMES